MEPRHHRLEQWPLQGMPVVQHLLLLPLGQRPRHLRLLGLLGLISAALVVWCRVAVTTVQLPRHTIDIDVPITPGIDNLITEFNTILFCNKPFAHRVERGWNTVCAALSGNLTGLSSDICELDASGGCDLTGFLEDAAACGVEVSGDDMTGTKGCARTCGSDLPVESCDYEVPEISWKPASDFGKHVANDPVVSNIDACVDAAYSMIPVDPLKPALEQRVWADLFGDGVFLKSGWTSSGLKSLSLPYATSSWDASKNSNTRRAQSLKVLACNPPHDAVFLNKNDPDRAWREGITDAEWFGTLAGCFVLFQCKNCYQGTI